MKLFFYPRLAMTNIKKNGKVYIPYLLTSAFTVMMFYLIYSLSINKDILNMKPGGATMSVILDLGVYVVIIFSIIFLFYINSFIIKRRKKEVALYNILGMEKKHVMIMMFCETFITTVISLVGGIVIGMLFSQLMYLLLIQLIKLNSVVTMDISFEAVLRTCLIFIPIFMASYLFNVIQIKLANPIALLRGGETGEKEPKAKWLMTLVGIITLGGGYYIAQTIEDPITAMMLFFIAVILVIIGTYCLFTSGSIMILKILKKNKHFYYQTKHFTSVSQLIYRMKQNAVGLASICILCTCILVMFSSTVSLYSGIEDTTKKTLDESFQLKFYLDEENTYPSNQDLKVLYTKMQQSLSDNDIEYTEFIHRRVITSNANYINQSQIDLTNIYDYQSQNSLSFVGMTLDEYNRAFEQNMSLKDDEILMSSNFFTPDKNMILENQSFHMKEVVDEPHLLLLSHKDLEPTATIVFKDTNTLEKVMSSFQEKSNMRYTEILSIQYEDEKQGEKADDVLHECMANEMKGQSSVSYYTQSHVNIRNSLTEPYGSLFFLGIFLGTLFLMAAILIMYYKQLSEGYEDQKRFEIMQNVGMSKKEVKQTIRSQVLIFFFLPLIVAVVHMAFAFKMIVNMFGALVLSGQEVFIICTVISVIILVIIYSFVYMLTARTYYKIVRHENK